MKNSNIAVLCYFLTLIFSVNSIAFSQNENKEFVISPRIGSEIDKNERVYFNLFPKIKNFKSAKIFATPDDGCSILVNYDSLNQLKSIEYFLNNEEILNLKTAIENYEYIDYTNQFSKSFDINWSKILSFIQPAFRYDSSKSKIAIKIGNKIIEAQLLWADSNLVVLSNENYKWNKFENHYKIFHFFEINEIVRPGSVTITGNKCIYLHNLGYLKDRAAFLNVVGTIDIPPPPEILKIIDQWEIDESSYTSDKEPSLQEILKTRYSKFHFSLFLSPNTYFQPYNKSEIVYSYNVYNNKGVFLYKATNSIDEIQNSGLNTISPELKVEYSILNNLRLGLGFSYYKTDLSEMKKNYIYLLGYSININADYILLSYNKYSLYLISNFEIGINLGCQLGNVHSVLNVDNPKGSIVSDKKEYNNSLFGTSVTLNINYYFTDWISVNTSFFMNILVPQNSFDWSKGNYSTSNDKLNYSGGGFKFGLGVHY